MSVQPHGTIDLFSVEYGIMMKDLIRILENNESSLTDMQRAFVHIAYYTECTVYTNIVQSESYKAVDSVETFFKLLAPYLKTPDCHLLKGLVRAANCEKAIHRLEKYLIMTSSLALSSDNSSEISLPSEVDIKSVISSEPRADSSTVPVNTRVSVAGMSWGMLRNVQSLLCGLFRVPQFALQYDKSESGSVIIKWITSRKIAVHIQAVVLDDGDLKLLLQERIVSVQVGMDYKIYVGNQEYWRVSHCMCSNAVIMNPVHMHNYVQA